MAGSAPKRAPSSGSLCCSITLYVACLWARDLRELGLASLLIVQSRHLSPNRSITPPSCDCRLALVDVLVGVGVGWSDVLGVCRGLYVEPLACPEAALVQGT